MFADPIKFDDDRIIRILKKRMKPETEFVLIPMNINANHWALAIIINVNLSLKPEDTLLTLNDVKGRPTPCFLYLDSLFKINEETRQALNRACHLFLKLKGEDRGVGTLLRDPIFPYYAYRLNIPKQTNGFDCGLFLLEYAFRFMLEPLELINY
jgi:Ulp1 family protease